MSAQPARAKPAELETALVARARAGDRTAFAELLRRYDADLRALAFRLLGDRDRMDDVLQETYVKAFRGLACFRGGSAFGTWLYRIAYNACLDELGRSRRVSTLPLEAAGDLAGLAPDLSERISDRHRLAAALASLRPPDRAAVLLVDAQGLDYAEAAEILGVPAGTIASRLNRARSVLRRALARTQEGASER